MTFTTVPKFTTKRDDLGQKREEKAQKQFKAVLTDIVELLRSSTDSETVSLNWVNKARGLFVLETVSTRCKNTMFQDRVVFENHFLDEYKDIQDPVLLEIGKHLPSEKLSHYYNEVPVRYLLLIPFVNNEETVAITVMESKFHTITEEEEKSIYSYMNALGNLLHTYLELSDLSEDQSQWTRYDEMLTALSRFKTAESMLAYAIDSIQRWISYGGVSLAVRTLNEWITVYNSSKSINALPLGLNLEEHSIGSEALINGCGIFNIHFNGNPKRISSKEPFSNGATFSVPLLIDDRRQMLFTIYDENPLIFNEATKHKISNLIRITSLYLQKILKKIDVEEDIFSHIFCLLDNDFWRLIIKNEIQRAENFPAIKTWFGLVAIDDVQTLRSKYRLDDLQNLQKEVVDILKPQKYGINGLLGRHSDYVYTFILQGESDEVITRWVKKINKKLTDPVILNNKESLKLKFHYGYTTIKSSVVDEEQIVSEAKTALAHAVKNPEVLIFEY